MDIVDEASCCQEGLIALKNNPDTDVIFLDVELPDGTGTSVNITGLSDNISYTVSICEYDSHSGDEKYNTSTATDNPDTFKTLKQGTAIMFR
jgi:DNA-binding NarL/FixJ family response regulator